MLLQARAGGRCECCGELLLGRCERHHRMRRRDGGDRLANLLVLLPACHAHWTAHPDEARLRGIIVPTYSSPEAAPVLWRGSSWLRLTDWGELLPGE